MARSILAADHHGLYARFGKRALDIVAVVLAAPLVLPLVAILALLGGGPAFFGQTRVGRGGRRFTCWKIRTMVPDADVKLAAFLADDPAAAAEWHATQKLRNDPRITPVGRLLRAMSLDELPQLWNVLIGDMSLVGPRPFLPEQQHLYPGSAYYSLRPGLTGFWQVGDRNDTTFAARAIDDARYARELGLGTDLATIARTLAVVARGTGC